MGLTPNGLTTDLGLSPELFFSNGKDEEQAAFGLVLHADGAFMQQYGVLYEHSLI